MEELKACVHALQAGEHKETIILHTIERLKSCNLWELSEYRVLVAATYYQLLRYCQDMYDINVPEHIVTGLLDVFLNIEQICTEATEEEKKDSNLVTIWFLHELKVHRESGDVWRIDDAMLRESIQVLLKELDNVYFIFEIRENGKPVFPIHEMIANVVKETGFVNIKDPLGIYHIHILQLAVRLFKDSPDKQEILQALVERCNLKFINYLHSFGDIIDSLDLLNYQKNGVMIFCDKQKNRVLIRNKSKDYFSVLSCEENVMCIEKEKDYLGHVIGYFVEYSLGEGDFLTDYTAVLKNESGREAFLRLIFDQKMYNVFFEHSIIRRSDGMLQPVNPFCYNDRIIIKGRLKGRNGKFYAKERLLDVLSRYRNSALKVSNRHIMNRVSFGLAILLLQKENIGMDALHLNEFCDEDWYQNQMLKNWAKQCGDSQEALTFLAGQWQRENEYCVGVIGSRDQLREKIEDHEIEALDFYPLKSEIDWMYQLLGFKDSKNLYILYGDVQSDDDENVVLEAELGNDICSKRFKNNTGRFELYLKLEDIKDPEGILDNGQRNYYFLYDSENQNGRVYNQELLKMLLVVEKIQERNKLTLETVCRINRAQYEEISSMMLLHKDALCEKSQDVFCDFDSQVYYRLVHNLIWAKISIDNIDCYLRVLGYHQRLEFKDIREDKKFLREDKNTLYVPKDGRKSYSVLKNIYEKYLESKSAREANDLYDEYLEKREDGYYHNDSYIQNIMFLCDNFEMGNATIRMLKAYLNIDITDETKDEIDMIEHAKSRCQKYRLKDEPSGVLIADIIKKNSCEIEVHAYYGTEPGKKAIESFFQKQCIKNAVVTYEKEIRRHASEIADDVRCIWPKARTNVYTVIREFNMTKGNIFPIQMLDNPMRAICLFVKKEEIVK